MAKCKKFTCIYKSEDGKCQATSELCKKHNCECWAECGNCVKEYECDEE